MSLGGAIAGGMRALIIAAATGVAALGLLAVLHPFAGAPIAPPIVGTPASDALHQQIADARDALRQTETAIAALATPSAAAPDAATGLDAQIAAATERRDLTQRHAKAIRDALKTGADLSGLAEIRGSAVIGQFFTQLSTLDATIAEQGARFKPNHPTMRGLAAQRTALLAQIDTEAGSIATSLEAEAKLDDAQARQLQAQRAQIPVAVDAGTADLAALQTRAAAQRATLDALMDSYFGLPRSTPAPKADPLLSALSPLNLSVVAIAALAALATQIGFALRRRRQRHQTDLARWRLDHDPELVPEPQPVVAEPTPPALRRAS